MAYDLSRTWILSGSCRDQLITRRSWVSKRKRLSIVFAQRYPTKQGVWRAEQAQATADDYATGEGKSRKRQKSHLRNQKRFHSRYNFGYGILLYIRKMPYFCPFTAHFGGFKGVFSYINDKSAILCPVGTEAADLVSFKGSIVQGINFQRNVVLC